jgi:DNA-binding transcriptional regulator LsrR (DeoR family)
MKRSFIAFVLLVSAISAQADIRRAGEVLTACARATRAKMRLVRLPQAKDSPSTDRVLLKRNQTREVLDVLNFEGYGIEGQELI